MSQIDATIFDDYGIPAHMQQSLLDWINKGWFPGSFLSAVLENNFMAAVGSADSINAQRLKEYAQFIYNEVPSACHGSKEKVTAWQERFAKAAA